MFAVVASLLRTASVLDYFLSSFSEKTYVIGVELYSCIPVCVHVLGFSSGRVLVLLLRTRAWWQQTAVISKKKKRWIGSIGVSPWSPLLYIYDTGVVTSNLTLALFPVILFLVVRVGSYGQQKLKNTRVERVQKCWKTVHTTVHKHSIQHRDMPHMFGQNLKILKERHRVLPETHSRVTVEILRYSCCTAVWAATTAVPVSVLLETPQSTGVLLCTTCSAALL